MVQASLPGVFEAPWKDGESDKIPKLCTLADEPRGTRQKCVRPIPGHVDKAA